MPVRTAQSSRPRVQTRLLPNRNARDHGVRILQIMAWPTGKEVSRFLRYIYLRRLSRLQFIPGACLDFTR